MRKILIAFIFFLFPAIAFSQVLNIEEERIKTDTTGWAGDAVVSFQLLKSDDQLVDLGTRLHLQYKTKRSLYLMLSDYSFVKAGADEYANSGFQHLRYNYKIKDWYTWEAFTQAQFNKVLSLKFRGLMGTGPRFKVIKTKSFRLYFAWLYMFEYEEIEQNSEINRNHRISSYVSFSWKLNDVLSLVNTTYYQPMINNFSDFRISAQTDLKIKISGKFSFSLGYNHYYDTDPPEGVVNTIYSLDNKLSFEF
ncbi:MAG: DUF481 domain-containing protein [Bacteroidota bacterium]